MADPSVARVQSWLDDHRDDLVSDLCELLRIPSLEGEPAPNAPFGPENRAALDWMLGKAAAAGMRTQDIEGYCGYAEFGDGERMIMSLGHLDVVPVGPGWKFEPFGATIDDGWIYARGASDDKGPTMAMFYALRGIKECVPDLTVRFRNVFGCNEESGFKCVERYMQTEEVPWLGVAPDGGWPCIHAEKGICDLVIRVELPDHGLQLLSLDGGQRPNIVIDAATASIRVDESILAEVKDKVAAYWDRNLTCNWDSNVLLIESVGKAAHGSRPHGGDNAVTRIARLLKELAPLDQQRWYEALFESLHIGGNGIGIAGADEPSGPLTCNLGIIATSDGAVNMTFNIRYPVTWKGDDIRNRAATKIAGLPGTWSVASFHDSKPLYFPLDHPLVSNIKAAYLEETGEDKAPGVMGGGTYARAVPNTVAIGTGWEGDGPAHETDERIKIEHLLRAAKIYANLMIRLARLP